MLSAIYQQYSTGMVKGNLEQVFTTALPGPSFPWQLGLAITAWADTLRGWRVVPKLLLSYHEADVQQGHAGSKATFPLQPTIPLSLRLQVQPPQGCWSSEAQGTCNNWGLYCLQESGSRGLAARWRCVAGQLPVSFALFQLSEFSLVFMASIAVVQTIYIALCLSYGQDWNEDEMLSHHRYYFTQTKPALSELGMPQVVSLCDANQQYIVTIQTHRCK